MILALIDIPLRVEPRLLQRHVIQFVQHLCICLFLLVHHVGVLDQRRLHDLNSVRNVKDLTPLNFVRVSVLLNIITAETMKLVLFLLKVLKILHHLFLLHILDFSGIVKHFRCNMYMGNCILLALEVVLVAVAVVVIVRAF